MIEVKPMPESRKALQVEVAGVATLLTNAGRAESALTRWTFRGSEGINYGFSISNADGESQQSRLLEGGCNWDPEGTLSEINVTAANDAFCGVSCSADKN